MRALIRPLPLLLAMSCASPPREPPAAEPPAPPAAPAPAAAPVDTIPTRTGLLLVDPRMHGTLRLEHNGRSIWIDPWSQADLSGPKADLLLITDVHGDHLDPAAIEAVRKEGTTLVGPAAVGEQVELTVTLANGMSTHVDLIGITAVPMYNHTRGPEPGKLYHDKGRGNGYVLEIADVRVYVAGDTACTDEMKALTDIDLAFIPMNLPYTMTPDEAADCIEAFRPKVVYPYHYRDSDLSVLEARLADDADIELRLRDWYPSAE